jgi:hypothetical protein
MSSKPVGWPKESKRHYEAKVYGKASPSSKTKKPRYSKSSYAPISLRTKRRFVIQTPNGGSFGAFASVGQATDFMERQGIEGKIVEYELTWRVEYLPSDSDDFEVTRGFVSEEEAKKWVEAEKLYDRADDVAIEEDARKVG